MKKLLASAALAAAVSIALPASAAVMLTTISGDYNDHPVWKSWSIELMYETSALALTDPSGFYSWDSSSGSPAPLMYAKGWVSGNTYCDYWDAEAGLCTSEPILIEFDKSEFTSFTIDRRPGNYLLSFEGAGISFLDLGHFYNVPDNPKINAAYSYWDYGNYGYGEVDGTSVGSVHTHGLDVTRSAVPEPATWAMMIVGFGTVGAGIRRSRRALLPGKLQPLQAS